jgi:ATP-dependent RNA helicase MSS116
VRSVEPVDGWVAAVATLVPWAAWWWWTHTPSLRLRPVVVVPRQAWLGFYNTHTKRLGWSKEEVIRRANLFASAVLSLNHPPAIDARTVGKMGLSGYAGLNIDKGGGGGGGGGGGRKGGGGKGGGGKSGGGGKGGGGRGGGGPQKTIQKHGGKGGGGRGKGRR